MDRPTAVEVLERGPRIVEIPRGDDLPPMQSWLYEDRPYPYIGLNAVAGKKPESTAWNRSATTT